MIKHPILHVEDSDDDVFLLNYAFREAQIKHPVQVVTDGQMAIDYLAGTGKFTDREQFALPCMVLLDLKLPQKMGLEVLEWIRQQPILKSIIVVVLSSSVYEGDIKLAYQLGVNAFLTKPSDVNSIIDMCKSIKHFWLTYNIPPVECREQ